MCAAHVSECPTAVQMQETAHAVQGHVDAHVGHVGADVSLPLEDDPMNGITLEVPTS